MTDNSKEEYLDSGSLGIRAVIKSDGVANLMSQKGAPLFCNAISHLPEDRQKTHLSQVCFFASH